jgi:ketosteroid isomerase-like protein
METRAVITRYYELANAGDWNAWTDLFATDQVMDEQVAGHIEGREALRKVVNGFPDLFASFQNVPKHIIVEGGEAAAVSHIVATTPKGGRIEVDVMNYFRVSDGLITYMSNYHDTVPVTAALSNGS